HLPRTCARDTRLRRSKSEVLSIDGRVDGIDLATLLSAWGSSNIDADINQDGIVSGLDLSYLLSTWGE
ncbi:MAG: hypothetical protein O2819_09670, partial [Planctomycetota bacterium]|nr:hypothetical protein [Planctomycetota bacterium]